MAVRRNSFAKTAHQRDARGNRGKREEPHAMLVMSSEPLRLVPKAIYDYLLTFEDERTLIWQSEWSFIKVVFLITRYFPIVDLSMTTSYYFKSLNPDECHRDIKPLGISPTPVSALQNSSRSWAVINFGIDVVIITVYFNSTHFTPLPAGVPGCLVSNGNSLLAGSWIIFMVFEAGILGMTLLKGIQLYQECKDKRLRNSALFNAIFTNGAIFYVYIFGLFVANVIVVASFSHDFAALLASVERVAHAVLAERLLITLRRAARNKLDEDNLEGLETLQFDQNDRDTIDTEVRISTFSEDLAST
ncbi:uncharacterized protein FOMMEDRAFT_161597 [Fomitiporia mediterranea MF3/22]|uniref:uncharacterized protein n=1 Tax=Fomitiporia mediterranea (strain MF3/22) TaxID=694068 RepID=UPI0004407DDC|nr:uncharacterized protein FOMMEDRAFT_161597 [Fomitiporia mediterranea MF3/22]EJC98763.1 hypothetical protein FOMMEDRAFT_161597 [Fomitiporia mediterranea MF3/22]